MQTKFKWTEKQRMLIIGGLSLGITITPSIEVAQRLAQDIYVFVHGTADLLNTDEYIQNKLKLVFEVQQSLGDNNLYEMFLNIERQDGEEQTSLSA